VGVKTLVISLAMALLGCSAKVDEPARVEPKPAAQTFVPLAPAPGRFVDRTGRISVPVPDGDGWECIEEQHGEGEAAAIAVRCRRADPHEFLFFAAKTHRQPEDQRVDAETVLMSLYRADNEGFFDRLEYTRSEAATLAGAQGWEAELTAEHARLGSIHKRERLAIVGDRVLAVSAEGSPALWDRHAAQMQRWFADVEFAR
jgi:hypothetical protein